MRLRAAVQRLAADGAVRWGACVLDPATGDVLAEHDADALLPTASVGKVLLLVALARALADGDLREDEVVRRVDVEPVADSGLWQHLPGTAELRLADAALLVGAVSDNLATNALLDRVGLDAVQRTAAQLGLPVHLHDRVRDVRGPQHPPVLSTATARGLAALQVGLARGRLVSPAVSARVLGWLADGCDLSMVPGRWGLDPLAHGTGPLRLHHKTGTDVGVRADTGLVRVGDRELAYAVLAHGPGEPARVLERMRDVGDALLVELGQA